ncbi:MAG: acyl-CoA dehydrogenase, partial [Neobacillus sp.]|nr:acyl-CoA dehydrogenase [Neobacillus sp.]
MLKELSSQAKQLRTQLIEFMEENIYPNEMIFEEELNRQENRWEIPPMIEELKAKAKAQGLWNLFIPDKEYGKGLSNYEYAHLCEIM